MYDIVISEFMDDGAVERLSSGSYPTLYDPGLVDRPADLIPMLTVVRALVVRTERRWMPPSSTPRPGSSASVASGSGSTT